MTIRLRAKLTAQCVITRTLSLTRTLVLSGVAVFVIWTGNAVAQDLEPRAYSASPIGLNFLVVGGGRSSGDVVTDPSLPFTNVNATLNATALGAGRTFNFFGRTALVVASFPYTWGKASGQVGEASASISRSGLADPRIKLSINLIGGRALSASEFEKLKPSTIVGVSVSLVPPLGQYDRHKLVNLGANRWSFKPEAGLSHAVNKWTFEGYVGVWLFTPNNEYFPGSSVRTQQPIVAVQAHTSYTLKPRLWTAFDATWYSGGAKRIDGTTMGGALRNARVGATVSVPLTPQQSLKFTYARGATTRVGANFTTLGAAWQLSWLD